MKTIGLAILVAAVFCCGCGGRLSKAGGTRAVLRIEKSATVPVVTPDVQAQVVQILHNRINAMGISEPLVKAEASDLIVVEMPLTSGASLAFQRKNLDKLVEPCRLEFIWLKDVRSLGTGANVGGAPGARYIYLGNGRVRDADTNRVLTDQEVRDKILYADPSATTIVTGADLALNSAKVDIQTGGGGHGVVTRMTFNEKGTAKLADFTTNHIHALLAIVLNGKILQAPRIQTPITDGTAVIEGGATTVAQAQELANFLNAGALPVPLTIVSVVQSPAAK